MKCPKRHGGGLVEVDVKSRAGKRAVGIPKPLIEAMREHRQIQEKEREAAGKLSMTTRYQHSTAELVAGIAKQVGGLLWQADEEAPTPSFGGSQTPN